MKILIACEESQTVCIEMRRLGHEAYSCDIQECSGGHPEWHIQGDVLPIINGRCEFTTMDGAQHEISDRWDMIIAHPPCTYLSNVGTRHFSPKCNPPERIAYREKLRENAADFFLKFANADCERIAIENPVGYMSNHYKKPTQIIEPYFFAESIEDSENYVTKRTCLWLKGLPPLKQINQLPRPEPFRKYVTKSGKVKGVCWAMNVSGKIKPNVRSCAPKPLLELLKQWQSSGPEKKKTAREKSTRKAAKQSFISGIIPHLKGNVKYGYDE